MIITTIPHHRKLGTAVVVIFIIFLSAAAAQQHLSLEHSANSSNCTSDKNICRQACNEGRKLPYSATYCDKTSGNCVCDCRDKLNSKCTFTPFTPCYSFCVNMNPSPEAYLYLGGVCPVVVNYPTRTMAVKQQCACQCSLREQISNDVN